MSAQWAFSLVGCEQLQDVSATVLLDSMVHARTQANSIDVWAQRSAPLVGHMHGV